MGDAKCDVMALVMPSLSLFRSLSRLFLARRPRSVTANEGRGSNYGSTNNNSDNNSGWDSDGRWPGCSRIKATGHSRPVGAVRGRCRVLAGPCERATCDVKPGEEARSKVVRG
jgi:hypothetical protein